MKAITVEPKKPGSARYEEFPEPDVSEGSVLVEAVAVGVCGTDVEIVDGKYGWAPPGKTRLVLGHESLGRVIDPGPRSSLKKGDLVVGIVRRPDPVPCPNCAVGEWDMCTNGQYTERGIKEIHGFMSERWRIEPEYAHQGGPFSGHPRRAARADDGDHQSNGTGLPGGPTRLLGTQDRAGDRRRADWSFGGAPLECETILRSMCWIAPRPDRSPTSCAPWVRRITPGSVPDLDFEPDIIVECTGVGAVIADSIQKIGSGGIICLTGVGAGGVASRGRSRHRSGSGPEEQS